MNLDTLQNLGRIAGIAGIAIGGMVLIFRDLLRKRIFPRLEQGHAYRLLRLIVLLAWSIAVGGILAWVFTSASKQENDTGRLELSDVLVDCFRNNFTCLVDFRLRNTGGSPLSISRIRLRLIDIQDITGIRTALPFSEIKGVNLTNYTTVGALKDVPVAESLAPGETGRIGIALGASLGPGIFRRWVLNYSFIADGGEVFPMVPFATRATTSIATPIFPSVDTANKSNLLILTLPWDIEMNLRPPV
jgi:hypothetical protein